MLNKKEITQIKQQKSNTMTIKMSQQTLQKHIMSNSNWKPNEIREESSNHIDSQESMLNDNNTTFPS